MTQATLSRDIHELGLVKTSEGYKLPQGEEAELSLPSIERLIETFVYDVVTAQNLVVIKTSAGSAQPVSAAIDAEEWEEVVGTIGGDDTILAIAPDAKSAEKLAQTIAKVFFVTSFREERNFSCCRWKRRASAAAGAKAQYLRGSFGTAEAVPFHR